MRLLARFKSVVNIVHSVAMGRALGYAHVPLLHLMPPTDHAQDFDAWERERQGGRERRITLR